MAALVALGSCSAHPSTSSRERLDQLRYAELAVYRDDACQNLHLTPPVKVMRVYECMCGGLHGVFVDANGKEEQFCFEGRGSRLGVAPGAKMRFGLGNCHERIPGAGFVPIEGAEENAICALAAYWLVDTFTLDELTTIASRPRDCTVPMSPARGAQILFTLFQSDPQRFKEAWAVIARGA